MPPHQRRQWSGRPCNFTTSRRRGDGDGGPESELRERLEPLLPRTRQEVRTETMRRQDGGQDGDGMEQDEWPVSRDWGWCAGG